jgi:hypothetical protein
VAEHHCLEAHLGGASGSLPCLRFIFLALTVLSRELAQCLWSQSDVTVAWKHCMFVEARDSPQWRRRAWLLALPVLPQHLAQ